MAVRGELAIRKQLQRERKHLEWLQRNMQGTSQARAAQLKILKLYTVLRVDMGADADCTKEKDAPKCALNFSRSFCSN
jgi:hypothetical protein